MKARSRSIRVGLLVAVSLSLSGCIVGTVVGAAVDVGVEVVKVPFKVGKGIYDVVKDDDASAKTKTTDAGAAGQNKE